MLTGNFCRCGQDLVGEAFFVRCSGQPVSLGGSTLSLLSQASQIPKKFLQLSAFPQEGQSQLPVSGSTGGKKAGGHSTANTETSTNPPFSRVVSLSTVPGVLGFCRVMEWQLAGYTGELSGSRGLMLCLSTEPTVLAPFHSPFQRFLVPILQPLVVGGGLQ